MQYDKTPDLGELICAAGQLVRTHPKTVELILLGLASVHWQPHRLAAAIAEQDADAAAELCQGASLLAVEDPDPAEVFALLVLAEAVREQQAQARYQAEAEARRAA
jgi:hypothetical protein